MDHIQQKGFDITPAIYPEEEIDALTSLIEKTDPSKDTFRKSAELFAIRQVLKGGILLMKPLLFHSSGRTIDNTRRRVLHIEFYSDDLPGGLEWAERMDL